jgi:hypothetical protein
LTLLARRRGGSAASKCFSPFFPRILIHLVGLDNLVRQSRRAGMPRWRPSSRASWEVLVPWATPRNVSINSAGRRWVWWKTVWVKALKTQPQSAH